MNVDRVGSLNSYQPSVIDGSPPQLDLSGAHTHLQQVTGEHSATAVEKAASAANKSLESLSSQIRFNVTNEGGRTVVKMIDTQTKQVLLQIPNEQMIRIAQDPAKLQGLAIETHA